MRFTPDVTNLVNSPIAEAQALLAHRENDRPLLNLSQAVPGYPPPDVITKAIAAAATDPSVAGYATPLGVPELRETFAADLSAAYSATLTSDDIIITAGCNQAFCVVTSALAGPGDNVLLATPFYFNHDMWLRSEGVEPRNFFADEAGLPSATEAESLIDDRTRAIVLVTPGNPTGVTIPPERIAEFARIARDNDLALILDETYRTFRPTNEPAHAEFNRSDWGDTIVSLHSFSKDLAIPGYRVGAVVGGERLRVEAAKLLDCVAISVPTIGQIATIAGLRHAGAWRAEQAARVLELQRRFEAVLAQKPGGFELISSGAYFGWTQAPGHESTLEIVKRLIVELDVLVIPGTAFTVTDERIVRFSFANVSAPQIEELGERLNQWTPLG